MKFYKIGYLKKKNDTFYEQQIRTVKDHIAKEEYGSDEWARDMKNLEYLQDECEKREKKPKKNLGAFVDSVVKVGGLVVSVAGLALTWNTAKMAYANDEDMKLCNGKVWKLRDDYNRYSSKPKSF